MESESGLDASPWGSNPFAQEIPPFAVAIRGEKWSRFAGRTAAMKGCPAAVAMTSPPFVAVAVAATLLVHVTVPAGRKKSCQNVFNGCARRPIGRVTHVPALDWSEVARGVDTESAWTRTVEAEESAGAPQATAANTTHARAVSTATRRAFGNSEDRNSEELTSL
jgi:hypothetical protein